MSHHRKSSYFDPQGIFQHELTPRQKKGMVLRPKPTNLSTPSSKSIPWTPEEMLNLLLQSGYINKVILHENINSVYTFAVDTYVAAGSTFTPLRSVIAQELHIVLSDLYTFSEDTYVAAGSTFDVQYPSEPTQITISGDYTFTEYTQFAPNSQIIVNWNRWFPLQYTYCGNYISTIIDNTYIQAYFTTKLYDCGFQEFLASIPAVPASASYYNTLDIYLRIHSITVFPNSSSTGKHIMFNNLSVRYGISTASTLLPYSSTQYSNIYNANWYHGNYDFENDFPEFLSVSVQYNCLRDFLAENIFFQPFYFDVGTGGQFSVSYSYQFKLYHT